MKKLLLGLGTLSLTALSVLTIVSCGGSTDGGDGGTNPDPETTTDLRITATPSTQSSIDKAIEDFNASGAAESDKVSALKTVFAGVTEANFKNFTVKATATSGQVAGTIVLTANKGFAFGSASTLTSALVVDLGIEPIRVAPAIITKAISDFKSAGTDALKVTALSTTFQGITETNFKNFDVTTTTSTITLTAKEGFIFGASKTLSSWSLEENFDLKIIAIPSTQTAIDKAITDFNASGAAEPDKVAALKTVFAGVTEANFKNFTVQATATSGSVVGKIVLTAKTGYTFNGQATLSSAIAQVVDLNITPKPSTQTVIDKAIKDFNAATANANKITALQTIFTGITSANFNNFDVTATATSGTTPGTITLTAKPGFSFGGRPTLISVSTSSPAADLGITAKPVVQSVINKAISDIQASGATNANKIAALQTVFNGITTANFNNFDGEVIGTAPSQQIRLTAKSGFNFSGQPTLISVSVTDPVVDLGITAKSVFQSVVNEAVRSILETPTLDNKIRAIQTMFNGVTEANFQHFDGSWSGPSTARVFRLTAKAGFNFSGQPTLTSTATPDPIVDLKITAIPSTQPTIDKAIKDFNRALIVVDKVTILSTVFKGITPSNFDKFEVEAIPTAGRPGRIVLTAKPNFTIAGNSTLTTIEVAKPPVVEGNLKITAKPAIQPVINKAITDINATGATNAQKITALLTVFNGITIANFNNFTLSFPGPADSQQILLTANSGFNFDGQQTLTSIPKEVTILPISKKPGDINQFIINSAIGLIRDAAGLPEAQRPRIILLALSEIFIGATAENLNNFQIETSFDPQNPDVGRIDLIAKEGFVFSKGESFLTTAFVKPDNWMQISARPNLQSEITKVSNLLWDVNAGRIPYDRENFLKPLQNLFSGITTENFDNFVTTHSGFGDKAVITLTAIEPYLFSDGSQTITSKVGTPDTWMNITPKPVAQQVIDNAAIVLGSGASLADKLTALQTVFNGVTEDNINNFIISFGVGTIKTIVLTAKDGYGFNNGIKVIESKASKVVELK